MRRIFLLIFLFPCLLKAQVDLQNLSWQFRGPLITNLGYKNVIDISHDPNAPNKLWACTLTDGLIFNENISDSTSQWKKSSLPYYRIFKVRFSPTNPKIVYALSDYRIWRSLDAGNAWEELTMAGHDFRFEDIWVSKAGKIILATNKQVFIYSEAEKKLSERFNSLTKIVQLWVQENERIYVKLADGKVFYSDNLLDWQPISYEQAAKEEMPKKILEQFTGYVIDDGTQLHGYTDNRKNIIDFDHLKYSTDGGKTYQSFKIDKNTQEIIFVKDELFMATINGIFKYDTQKGLISVNNGVLLGDYSKLSIRNLAGDNYVLGVLNSGFFMMNEKNVAQPINVMNTNTPIYDISDGFIAYDTPNDNYWGNVNGRKVYKVSEGEYLLINFKGNIIRIFSYNTSPFIINSLHYLDFDYNATTTILSTLTEEGEVIRYKRTPRGLAENPLPTLPPFGSGKIIDISDTSDRVLVTDKKANLWFWKDGQKDWKSINLSIISSLKINTLAYLPSLQAVAVGTESGLYFIQGIETSSPTVFRAEGIGNQPITDIQYREVDEYLAVMSRFKGVYNTHVFTKPNQLITQSFDYVNSFPNSYIHYTDPLMAGICENQKIRVHFKTNISATKQVKYQVEVSDDNGNFPEKPFLLEGSSSQSPVEVMFKKPQSPTHNNFRVRVIATGDVEVKGTPSVRFGINQNGNATLFTPNVGYSYAQNVCLVDSFRVFTDLNPKYRYRWFRENIEMPNVTAHQLYVKDNSTYEVRFQDDNGCMVAQKSIKLNGCEGVDNQLFILNSPIIAADKTQLLLDEKATIKTMGCSNVNFQWQKDGLLLKDKTTNLIETNEVGVYRLKISKGNCSAISNEVRITAETVLANEELANDLIINVFPNPASEFISIESKKGFDRNLEIQLLDNVGKHLQTFHYQAFTKVQIPLHTLQTGVYFLSISNQQKKILKKIIVN